MLTFPEIKSFSPPQTEVAVLGFPVALKYLRDRGVGEDMLGDLGIQILPAAEIYARTRMKPSGDDRLAVVIPHYDLKGDFIDWWSARLVDAQLRPVTAVSFANLLPHKRGKMACPPNEPPHAYLPPILNWQGLQRGDKIYIHESAIKAINGARLGAYSVGLNGVWGWGSRKHGVGLVQELRDLPWRPLDLQPIVVFDSNAADNWDVQAAITGLAGKLFEITGKEVKHVLLPRSPEGEHWGFDDFCVRMGDDAAVEYLTGEGASVELDEVTRLKIQLNSEVVVVRSMSRIADQKTGRLMRRGDFTEVNYAHFLAKTVDDKWVNVPRLWLQDSRRAEVESLTYLPGKPTIVEDQLNMWRGMGADPAGGDVSRWLSLLEKNVEDETLRKWVIQWMAYPLQNLGAKMTTFLHLFGPPGSGKQAVAAPLMKIYGGNSIIVGKTQLSSDFNSIYKHKQFINIDEIHSGSDNDKINNKLKMLITGETMIVNTKGDPEYEVPNKANFLSTSNYPDSIKFDDDDRRACVIQFGKRGEGANREFWISYYRWIQSEGGAEAVYDYLLGVSLEGFDPTGWAPMTDAKMIATQSSRKVDEAWVGELWEEPDQVLPHIMMGRALMTSAELGQLCFGGDPSGVTPGKVNALGVKLHTAGFRRVEIKLEGKKVRFWVIRDREKEWGLKEIRQHLMAFKYPGA